MSMLAAIVGPDHSALSWWQEIDRAVIIFAAGLAMIRLSGLRTFSRFSPLDTIVTIVIGSNLSRALTGSAAFAPTLTASLVFVLLHRVLAQLALHSPALSRLLKGEPKLLATEGELRPDTMRKEAITLHDVEEAMRLRGLARLDEVRTVTLELNGSISLQART